jgi:hypothetical protein
MASPPIPDFFSHNYCAISIERVQALLPNLESLFSVEPIAVFDGNKTCFFIIGPELFQRFANRFDNQAQFCPTGPVQTIKDESHTFAQVSDMLMEEEMQRVELGVFSEASLHIIRNRLDKHILPAWGSIKIDQIDSGHIHLLMRRLLDERSSPTTVSQYFVIVRKVFRLAKKMKWIQEIPDLPRIHIDHKPRSTFSLEEYKKLLRTSKRLVRLKNKAPALKASTSPRSRFWVSDRYRVLQQDFYWLLIFMVNSFVRPSDIKWLQHKHISVLRTQHAYLRLTLPVTKRHDKPIVSLQPAVRAYESLRLAAAKVGKANPEDYVFLKDEPDRDHALAILNFWLKWVLREAGLALCDNLGQPRSLYCLRHTAITFRLLYGQGIDMLTLARNARTSVDMIEKFYASTLTGEMNVGMLQSRRTQKKTPSREARG